MKKIYLIFIALMFLNLNLYANNLTKTLKEQLTAYKNAMIEDDEAHKEKVKAKLLKSIAKTDFFEISLSELIEDDILLPNDIDKVLIELESVESDSTYVSTEEFDLITDTVLDNKGDILINSKEVNTLAGSTEDNKRFILKIVEVLEKSKRTNDLQTKEILKLRAKLAKMEAVLYERNGDVPRKQRSFVIRETANIR